MPETLVSVRPSPVHAVRWAAVLAGMSVGIALHLVFTLAGAALGFALYEPGTPLESLPVAAAVWNVVSMLIAAFIGGYVAARASGLRRLADGVLHGTVSWGATTLLFAVLATTALGAMFGGLFGLVAPQARIVAGPAVPQSSLVTGAPLAQSVIEAMRRGDRASAVRRLQEQRQLTEEEAHRSVELAAELIGRAPVPPAPDAAAKVEQTAAVAAAATAWLASAVVLSLIAGMAGGGIGARGARRVIKGASVKAEITRPLAEPAR
jgi:hypothetical protein